MVFEGQLGLEDVLFRKLKTHLYFYAKYGNEERLESAAAIAGDAQQFSGNFYFALSMNQNQHAIDFEKYVKELFDSIGRKIYKIEDTVIFRGLDKVLTQEPLRSLQGMYVEMFNREADKVLRIGEFLAMLGGDVWSFDFLRENGQKYGARPYVPPNVVEYAMVEKAFSTGQTIVSRNPERDYVAGRFAS